MRKLSGSESSNSGWLAVARNLPVPDPACSVKNAISREFYRWVWHASCIPCKSWARKLARELHVANSGVSRPPSLTKISRNPRSCQPGKAVSDDVR